MVSRLDSTISSSPDDRCKIRLSGDKQILISSLETENIDCYLENVKPNKMMLFTDGSVHSKLNIGFGAYLLVSEEKWTVEALKKAVNIKRFDDTSSTKLELQILLFALSKVPI